jgi:hypothetical protein
VPAGKLAFIDTEILRKQNIGLDIGKDLNAFAAKYGVTLLLDVSKLSQAVSFSDGQINLTQAFIAQLKGKKAD